MKALIVARTSPFWWGSFGPCGSLCVTDEILNFYILLCLALACAAIVMLTD